MLRLYYPNNGESNGKENGKWDYIGVIYWGNIGVMEKKMETTVVYWGTIGVMEKKMETTIVYSESCPSASA